MLIWNSVPNVKNAKPQVIAPGRMSTSQHATASATMPASVVRTPRISLVSSQRVQRLVMTAGTWSGPVARRAGR